MADEPKSEGYVATELVEAADLMPPDIQGAMPQVNPAAVAAESRGAPAAAAPAQPAPPAPAQPAAAAAAPAVKPAGPSTIPLTCANGMTFDPVHHECTLFGKPIHNLANLSPEKMALLVPVLRADGKTLKRRRSPLAEIQTTSHAPDPSELDPPPVAPAAPAPAAGQPAVALATAAPTDAEVKACAATVSGLQLMLMRAALGDKIGEDQEQRDALTGTWEATIRHYGWGAFHPLLAVAVVTGGMIVTAATKHEETRTRLGQCKDWFAAKWTATVYWWRHRRGQPHTEAA